jgi:hypothetical protein
MALLSPSAKVTEDMPRGRSGRWYWDPYGADPAGGMTTLGVDGSR